MSRSTTALKWWQESTDNTVLICSLWIGFIASLVEGGHMILAAIVTLTFIMWTVGAWLNHTDRWQNHDV